MALELLEVGLDATRDELLVGRETELGDIERLFELADRRRFLYVDGPGGIGKSTLLHAAERRARALGWTVTWIDGRSQFWTEQALTDTILAGAPGRRLVAIDHFEALNRHEDALRTRVLPRLDANVIVLAAGRVRLSPAWALDAGWQAALGKLHLGNLTLASSAGYLERLGFSPTRALRLAEESRGFPLALALLGQSASRAEDAPVELGAQVSTVTALVDHVLADATPMLVSAVRACAITLFLSEAMLRDIVQVEDARSLFDQLRALSFVDVGPGGLVLHDVVRVAVLAELGWRDPARHAEFLHRAARHLEARWHERAPGDPLLVRQVIHLISQLSTYPFDPNHRDDLVVGPADPSELGVIDEMCREHEGPESLAWLQYWRERGAWPRVYRTESGTIAGFSQYLDLSAISWEDASADPGTAKLWQYYDTCGARAAGPTPYARHWMTAHDHQVMSPVQSELFFDNTIMLFSQHNSAAARSAHDIGYWKRFVVPGMTPELDPELEFESDGQRHGIFKFARWDALPHVLARLQLQLLLMMPAMKLPPAPLDEHTFNDAARQALRVCDRSDLLESNPLCRARIVEGATSTAGSRAAVLVAAMRAECDRLFASPRDRDIHRVLVHTYFEPAGKQEAVAGMLGLSWGTYRRYLTNGTKRLIESLWAKEQHAPRQA